MDLRRRSYLTESVFNVLRDVKEDGYTKRGTYQRNVVLKLPTLFKKSGSYETYKLRG